MKTIRVVNLIIGITILLASSGCKTDVGLISKGTYVYINGTAMNIDMTVIDRDLSLRKGYLVSNTFLIEPNDSISFQMEGEGSYPFYLPVEGSVSGDSAIIKKGTKCLTYTVKYEGVREGSGVFNLNSYDNFSSKIYDSNEYTLFYTFKEEEFDYAINCN